MAKINDGGPAFPLPLGTTNCAEPAQSGGMSLRDYFAAKAMQGFSASNDIGWRSINHIAETAYEWADAMLAARESHEGVVSEFGK